VVFFSFAWEAVPADQPAPNNRVTLLATALRFLTPDLVSGSTVAFDQSAYTVPGNVVVETTDSRRAGQGQVSVAIANGEVRQTLNLAETARPGVFRGRLTLQPAPTPASPGQLPAQNGDTLRATYVDAANAETSVEAPVDTVKPVISRIESDPAYNEALVGWTTDKPADALVRFGESGGDDSFLTRSAYSAALATEHEVQLQGLLPDKTYYFQVVSRDAAGNMTVDNRNGQFYTVRTLKPLSTPWIDNLDAAEPGWAVYEDSGLGVPLFPGDDEDDYGLTGTVWQFGEPQNALGVTARTGTNVWATNLKGEAVDFSITDLITPAISLVDGTKATLRFWQYYDFSVTGGSEDDPFGDFVLEAAQVALSTDNGATWKDLYSANDEFTVDWEEVAIDLSKYTGQVVRFRFNYQLFAFTPGPRVGWLIDDLNVTMSASSSTELQVTNNLAQAAFSLTGPDGLILAGAGLNFRTNTPAGVYVIAWQPVPYYVTPPSQTNSLGPTTPLVFHGAYSFPDLNSNGISDLWEQHFFGTVESPHPPGTDTDDDYATDWQEFLAGTDPTDPGSWFYLAGPVVQPNRTVRFAWLGASGREYVLETSNDLASWVTVGDTQRGQGDVLSTTLPALDPSLAYYFRLRATP
jgi:hypothetical protein